MPFAGANEVCEVCGGRFHDQCANEKRCDAAQNLCASLLNHTATPADALHGNKCRSTHVSMEMNAKLLGSGSLSLTDF